MVKPSAKSGVLHQDCDEMRARIQLWIIQEHGSKDGRVLVHASHRTAQEFVQKVYRRREDLIVCVQDR